MNFFPLSGLTVLRLSVALCAGVLLVSCSVSPTEKAAIARPEPVAEQTKSPRTWTAQEDQSPSSMGESLAGVRAPDPQSLEFIQLERVLEKEKMLMLEVMVAPDQIEEGDKQRKLMEVVRSYENFISQNPESEYGLILYGKFLRKVGLNKKANNLFARVNKLNPNIAVVKQQIGNFMAEEGMFELALPYFLSAIELEPHVARYHYQLGELLYTYYEAYLSKEIYTRETLDQQMMHAFRRAAELAPDERTYRFRYAEAFYDVEKPVWSIALKEWNQLLDSARSDREADVIRMHMARVNFYQGDFAQAETILNSVSQPVLEESKQALLAEVEQRMNHGR